MTVVGNLHVVQLKRHQAVFLLLYMRDQSKIDINIGKITIIFHCDIVLPFKNAIIY